MTNFHKADTEEQKAIRVFTEEVYCDLRDMVSRNAGKEEIVSFLDGIHNYLVEHTGVVVDNAWDDVEGKDYGFTTTQEFIAAHIHTHIVVGIGGIMPIGKHIIADLQARITFYKGV